VGETNEKTVTKVKNTDPFYIIKLNLIIRGGEESGQADLSWEKKAFQESVEKLFSFLGAFHKEMNYVFLNREVQKD